MSWVVFFLSMSRFENPLYRGFVLKKNLAYTQLQYVPTADYNSFVQLKNRISEIDKDIDIIFSDNELGNSERLSLSEKINKLQNEKADKSALDETKQGMDNEIKSVKNDITELYNTKAENDTVKLAQTNINILEYSLADTSNQISNLRDTVNANMEINEANIELVKDDVDTIMRDMEMKAGNDTVDYMQKDIDTIENQIDLLDDEIDKLHNIVNTNNSAISQLNSNMEANKSDVESAISDLESNKANKSDVESAISQLNSNMEANKSEVDAAILELDNVKAGKSHSHVIEDITNYEPYDDTRLSVVEDKTHLIVPRIDNRFCISDQNNAIELSIGNFDGYSTFLKIDPNSPTYRGSLGYSYGSIPFECIIFTNFNVRIKMPLSCEKIMFHEVSETYIQLYEDHIENHGDLNVNGSLDVAGDLKTNGSLDVAGVLTSSRSNNLSKKYKFKVNEYQPVTESYYYGIELPYGFASTKQANWRIDDSGKRITFHIVHFANCAPIIQIRNGYNEVVMNITNLLRYSDGSKFRYQVAVNDSSIGRYYYGDGIIYFNEISQIISSETVFSIWIEQIDDSGGSRTYYPLCRLQTEAIEGVGNTKPEDNELLTFSAMREFLYPVGSIYTSMNNINPGLFIGGEWDRIEEKFLYCAKSSGVTGGSKKITVGQLPAHNHSITELDIRGNEDGENEYTIARYGGNDTTITTGTTGNGEDYMPPYMTVYAWYRTA